MGEIARQIPHAELRLMHHSAVLAGTARALGLLQRMPELFTQRGWPHAEDAIAVAVAAVCCVKVGAVAQRFRLPDNVAALGELWRGVVAIAEDGMMRADALVAALELGDLLEPV